MLHAEDTDDFDRFRHFIERLDEQFSIVDAVTVEAPAPTGGGSRLPVLITFDDGHARTFPALEWLAQRGISTLYFLIPSYIDRSVQEFLDAHAACGVEAYNIGSGRDLSRTRGFSRSQVRELQAMGHRIGAHNDAHRDLGRWHTHDDARYEILGGMARLEDICGTAINDFAWAFGRMRHLSQDALSLMAERFQRVYSGIRGRSSVAPRNAASCRFFFRTGISLDDPQRFVSATLRGGLDVRDRGERASLAHAIDRL